MKRMNGDLQWRKLQYRTFLRSAPRSYNFLTLDVPLEHRERRVSRIEFHVQQPRLHRHYSGAESVRNLGRGRDRRLSVPSHGEVEKLFQTPIPRKMKTNKELPAEEAERLPARIFIQSGV